MKDTIIRVISISLIVISVLACLFFLGPTMEVFRNHDIYRGNLELAEGASYKIYTGFDCGDKADIENEEIITATGFSNDADFIEFKYDKVLNPNGLSGQYMVIKAEKLGRTVLKITEKRFLVGDNTYIYDVSVVSKIEDLKEITLTDSITGAEVSAPTGHLNILGEPDVKNEQLGKALELSYGSKYSFPVLSNSIKNDYILKAYDIQGNPTDVIKIDDDGYLRAFAPINGYCHIYSQLTGGIRFYFSVKDDFKLYDNVKKSYEYKNKKEPEVGYLSYKDIEGLNECVIDSSRLDEERLKNCLPAMDTLVVLNPGLDGKDADSILSLKPGKSIKKIVLTLDERCATKQLENFNKLMEEKMLPNNGRLTSISVDHNMDIDIYPGVVLNSLIGGNVIMATKGVDLNINFKSYADEKFNTMYAVLNGSNEENNIDGRSPLDIKFANAKITADNSFVIKAGNAKQGPNNPNGGMGLDGGTGGIGLDCGNLNIILNSNNTFGYIMGGHGGIGGTANSGGWRVGGDGYKGGTGGVGGAALEAIRVKISGYGDGSSSRLYLLPGVGGAGGTGSNGFNGGTEDFFRHTDGGNGGAGGEPGLGGLAIKSINTRINFNVVAYEGLSLRSGKGGAGGEGWGLGNNGRSGDGYNGANLKRVAFDEAALGHLQTAIEKGQYAYSDRYSFTYNRVADNFSIFKNLYI